MSSIREFNEVVRNNRTSSFRFETSKPNGLLLCDFMFTKLQNINLSTNIIKCANINASNY